MKVLFASSEMVPYASTGGLADVAKALPEALEQLGVEVVRVMPCYRQVVEKTSFLRDTQIRLHVPVGLNSHTAEVWTDDSVYPRTYFIRRDEYFDRTFLYGLASRDYDDNFDRFTFFQKAIVALIDQQKIAPDIVHANDWQTGILPLFLRHGIHGGGRAQKEKVIFTIHNLAYQGIFPGSSFPLSNLPFSCFNMYEMEYYNQLNCLKAGIVVSQYATTVSPTYAKEIKTVENGCGLDGVLQDKGDRLLGILNGVSYADWNPADDPHIRQHYTPDNLEGKAACKAELLSVMNLEPDVKRPLIGMVTRLAEQKGLDILAQAIEAIMAQDCSVAVLGTGQPEYHELCAKWAEKWKGRFAVRLEYNNTLAHQIEAGSDLFLMPSRFEPCGLNQLYSLKYGTIPVVHATGGLKDTIQELNAGMTEGNGFAFEQYSGDALTEAVRRALSLFVSRPDDWKALMARVMQADYSWEKAAQTYLELYHRALA